jgi:hypothetical protein
VRIIEFHKEKEIKVPYRQTPSPEYEKQLTNENDATILLV